MDQEQNPAISKILEYAKEKNVISWDENDGMYIPFEDAMRYCENTYASVILIGNSFSLFPAIPLQG